MRAVRRVLRSRQGYTSVAAGLVAVVVAAGAAYAATSGVLSAAHTARAARIYACVTTRFGTLNLSSARAVCPAGEHKISWNAAGPRGLRGPRGSVGRRGAAGKRGTAGSAGAKGQTGLQGNQGPAGIAGATGPAGPSGTSQFAEFYALMPPDNSAAVAPGAAVSFPHNGPQSGSITALSASTFQLSAIGTYRVLFQVPVTEPGQLELTLNGTALPYTVVGRDTGTTEIIGAAFISVAAANSVLAVVNPTGNAGSLTITPHAGGAQPVSASLIIQKLA
jgi:hypothetical protein